MKLAKDRESLERDAQKIMDVVKAKALREAVEAEETCRHDYYGFGDSHKAKFQECKQTLFSKPSERELETQKKCEDNVFQKYLKCVERYTPR